MMDQQKDEPLLDEDSQVHRLIRGFVRALVDEQAYEADIKSPLKENQSGEVRDARQA